MSVRLRRVAVQVWRFFTGPASVVVLLAVAAYLLLISWGLPLFALWLLGRALFGLVLHHLAPHQGWLGLGGELAALVIAWLAARRWLPPFRWRY